MVSVLDHSRTVSVIVFQCFITAAVQQYLLEFFRQFFIWKLYIRIIFIRQSLDDLPVKARMLHCRKDVAERFIYDAGVLIRYQQIRVDSLDKSQTVTFRTCSHRVIEGEHSRFQLLNADTVVRTCKTGTESLFPNALFVVDNYLDQTVTVSYREFACFRQSALYTVPNFDTVNNDFDSMFKSLFQGNLIFTQNFHFIVYTYTYETFLLDPLQNFFVHPFFLSDYRCQDSQLCALAFHHQQFDDLVCRLAGDFPAADRTVRHAYTGVQQSQIVVYFRNSSHCRSRVLVRSLLVDGNRR